MQLSWFIPARAAQLIARLLDSLGKAEGILGTIAGDDTIFTTPANGFTVKDLYEAILELFDQSFNLCPVASGGGENVAYPSQPPAFPAIDLTNSAFYCDMSFTQWIHTVKKAHYAKFII